MRISLATIFAIAVSFCLLGAGQAVASATHGSSLKTVTVVMHDPGCHWFSVGGKYVTKLTVKGPISLANYDEAALKVTGVHGTQRDAVGHKVTLKAGTYKITMVGQASDDNTLRLIVR